MKSVTVKLKYSVNCNLSFLFLFFLANEAFLMAFTAIVTSLVLSCVLIIRYLLTTCRKNYDAPPIQYRRTLISLNWRRSELIDQRHSRVPSDPCRCLSWTHKRTLCIKLKTIWCILTHVVTLKSKLKKYKNTKNK